LGKIEKGLNCSVLGCNFKAARSISSEKVQKAGLKTSNKEKRVYLCKQHYKEYKKKTKKDKNLEKWRYNI
jgi:hypothetical protein